jgi:hypothetical protein
MKNLQIIVLTLGVGLSAASLSAQAPANNNCLNATPLPVGSDCVSGTLAGSTIQTGQVSSTTNHCGASNFNQTIWYSFTATSNEIYISLNDITLSGGGSGYFPGRLTTILYNTNSCLPSASSILACDNHTGGTMVSSSTLTPGQTYLIQIGYNNGNGSQQVSFCINSSDELPYYCSNIQPFCSDSPINFPASTNTDSPSGPAYGCLASQPNPAWFYLEIANPGNLNILLSPSPSRDIDYILWGPFQNFDVGCELGGISSSSKIVSCSFSASHSETVSITNAQSGEVYILLITNFSNLATNISVSQTSGSGSTNCGILLPVELMSFDAKGSGPTTNLLSWSTASERNNNYFMVENSVDGKSWTEIAKISGAGNSSAILHYQAHHIGIKLGTNYYRLSQVDYDGTTEVFDIISIDNSIDQPIVVKSINLMGQTVDDSYQGIVIHHYSDGSIRKVLK